MLRPFVGCVVLLLLSSRGVAQSGTQEDRALTAARIGSDAPALLDFLRKRTVAKVERTELLRLVRQLGEGEADATRAQGTLIAYGYAAVPILREIHKETALVKARPRIEECLKWIEGPNAEELLRAIVRRLVRLQPAEMVEVLLAFVARGDEEGVDEARQALVGLAVRAGKINRVLETAALEDKEPTRRRAAIDILCRADAVEVIRQLFRDPAPEIRLHTAALRLEQGDVEALPILVNLLSAHPKGPKAALEPLEKLAGPLAPTVANPLETPRAWADWWRDATADSVAKFFKERTPTVDLDRVGELVEQLGSRSFRTRNRAEQELIRLRGLALPWLQKAAQSEDIEVRQRVERCLKELRDAPDADRCAARVRLLALRRPPETTRLLLGFAPFADNEAVVEEIGQALRLVQRRDPETLTLLKAALSDKAPQRRSLAADVLAEVGAADVLPELRKLLRDADPGVRWKAGLGLAQRQERAAVPVLIDLLAVLPVERGWTIEDVLRRLAADRGPTVALDASDEGRKKCRDLWAAWWQMHGAETSLAGLGGAPAELGLTLVSLWGGGGNNCSVVELGRDQKERWKIENLGYVFDFVVLSGNRLLLVENTLNKVTERNYKGEVLWEYSIPGPINCQRLPSGHVFVANSNGGVVVDRQKNVVTKYDASGLMGGQRFRDGKVVLLDGGGVCHVFDADGKKLKTFQIEGGMSNYGGVQETSSGHFLVAQHHRAKVSEYDLDGKLVWSCDTPSPNFATRLRNGHTLVGSQDNRSLIEVDRAGKVVSEYKPGVSVWRGRRR